MATIAPIPDLKNYMDVLGHCDNGSVVHLTENGRVKYVIQTFESYEKTQAEIQLLAALSQGLEPGVLSVDEAFDGLETEE